MSEQNVNPSAEAIMQKVRELAEAVEELHKVKYGNFPPPKTELDYSNWHSRVEMLFPSIAQAFGTLYRENKRMRERMESAIKRCSVCHALDRFSDGRVKSCMNCDRRLKALRQTSSYPKLP